jgi:signal peptide peptidase SppA
MIKKLCKLFKSKPTVAVIRLQGVISTSEGGALRPPTLSFEAVQEYIEQAFNIPKVKAVALAINSPGGSPVQSELIFRYIRSLAEKKSIPVLAFAEDVAASGGYFLACAGDEIFASESSLIGSIGVISAGFGFQEAIHKLGIERRIYTQGTNKSLLDPFLPERDSDIEILKNAQKDVHESFKSIVRSRRGNKLNDTEDRLFSGEFWSGKTALSLGLVDHIGSLTSVLKERFGDDVKLVKLSKERSFIKKLLGMSLTPHTIIQAVEQRLIWSRFGL